MLLALVPFYILIILGNIETAFSQECAQRDELEAGRDCERSCEPDGTCRKQNRECVCDGLCGLSCLRKKCPLLTAPLNGDMVINPNERTIGAEVSYSCNNGYVIFGHENRVCQANKTWSGIQPICIDYAAEETCDENDLPVNDWQIEFTYPDGASHDAQLAHLKPTGTIARFNCEHFGYSIFGSNAKICRGGEWQVPETSCEKIRCPLFELNGGILEYRDENNRIVEQPRHGDIRTATCSDGYTLNGMSQTLCSAGVWQDELPRCERRTAATPRQYGIRIPLHSRIVGGTDASEGSWPWIGSLGFSGISHSCGTTLIHPYWAVTAAHCVGHFDTIVLGFVNFLQESQHREVRRVLVHTHPNYNSITYENDIALLQLQSPINVTDYVRPACIADARPEVLHYTDCMIAGWGRLESGGESPDHLQIANVRLFNQSVCKSFLGSRFYGDVMLCGGYVRGGIDTCQGDSGGPFVCRDLDGFWTLIGVTSWGDGCADPESPGVYTRITSHIDFIESHLNAVFCQSMQLENGRLEYHDSDNMLSSVPRHGDYRLATCEDGYSLQGTSQARCWEGEWEEELPTCQENFDECSVVNICDGPEYECIKYPGTYECACAEGYVLDENEINCIAALSCPVCTYGSLPDNAEELICSADIVHVMKYRQDKSLRPLYDLATAEGITEQYYYDVEMDEACTCDQLISGDRPVVIATDSQVSSSDGLRDQKILLDKTVIVGPGVSSFKKEVGRILRNC